MGDTISRAAEAKRMRGRGSGSGCGAPAEGLEVLGYEGRPSTVRHSSPATAPPR